MNRPASRSSGTLLALAYLAFISLGLPDAVLGVAWPSVRDSFQLPQALLGAPLALAATAYFFSGLLAGRLIQRAGIGLLLAGSTALVATGVLVFSAARPRGPGSRSIGVGSWRGVSCWASWSSG
jgi:fucose permease